MKAPTNINEVQQLTERIDALRRFISKATEKNLPFFKVLRKAKNFEWDTSYQQAFEELKTYLVGVSVLSNLVRGTSSTYAFLPLLRQLVLSSFEKMKENKYRYIMSARCSMVRHGIAHKTKTHFNGASPIQWQVEVTNRILIQGIKRRLERVGGSWTEELTSVSWAYRTTPQGCTGESPFTLVYGTKVIILRIRDAFS
ncbi:UNVERIFIED_CONTAM: hypothetical protein Sradi_3595100 [Sesamum radiatum]|uniref:Reverse transcriptase/retrotransposon-derived protein RNase H-like domain-containing protein n=1 Tax=Sesamum radiatum TaxID=300843 RepID=A0AAW2QH14_SESRA